MKSQIDSDTNTLFHPETATLLITISVGDDGNLSSITQSVRYDIGQLWTSSETDSSGTRTTTNHRNKTTETRKLPRELVALHDPV